MLDELEWPSLEARRDRSSLLCFHKIHCGAVSIEKKYLILAHSLQTTRSSHRAQYCILCETSKPPLNIFSYILKYMIHTWLKFALNIEKSIKQNLSKFHFYELKKNKTKKKKTCSVDRLYKGTIAFHFHTNARI